jgi:hypothetical protein
MQAGTDCADWDVEDEGDLLVGQLFELAEDDDLFEDDGQRVKAIAKYGEGFGAGEEFGGAFVEGGRVEGFVGGVYGDEALGAFQVAPQLTAGDAAEPCGECSPALDFVAAGVAEEGEEDLLGDLFGDSGVAAEAESEAVDERAVAVVKSGDGVGGSLLRCKEELVV